jgi:hypothetical protein
MFVPRAMTAQVVPEDRQVVGLGIEFVFPDLPGEVCHGSFLGPPLRY